MYNQIIISYLNNGIIVVFYRDLKGWEINPVKRYSLRAILAGERICAVYLRHHQEDGN